MALSFSWKDTRNIHWQASHCKPARFEACCDCCFDCWKQPQATKKERDKSVEYEPAHPAIALGPSLESQILLLHKMDLSSHDEMEHDSEIHHMMAHHHHHHRRVSEQQRRQSGMSIEEERERRASIKDIMQDPDLTPLERRQSIQSLMDGRRRSSRPFGGGAAGMSMAAAAAAAAADFEDSSDDEDDMQDDTPHVRDTRHSDSTVSSSSTPTGEVPSQFFMPPPPGQMARSASISAFPATTNGQGTTALQQQDMRHECTTNTTTANASSKILEEARPPCSHYERRCSLVAPCCGLAFGCRICHDECPVLPTPMEPGKRRKSLPLTLEPDLEHHCIDRFAITQVICRECFTKQDSKT